VDPVPDPLLLRKSGSARNRTLDLCVSSQELWPLDYRGGQLSVRSCVKENGERINGEVTGGHSVTPFRGSARGAGSSHQHCSIMDV
jgi:hypothetical protein